jgi:glycosyltransferase involved in cell wall biosynthesis
MRIGINARTFSVDEPGGAVQASINQAKGLINHTKHEVLLFGSESVNQIFTDSTVISSGYPVESQLYGIFWERTVLPRIIDANDIDVFYCPNGNGPVREFGCPIVMCIHDINAQKNMSNVTHYVYRKLSIPRGAKIADYVVTVSEFSKNEIINELEVPSQKVNVIYNGIDSYYRSSDPGTEFELPDKYVLFVGSMNPRKNINRIIKSFDKIKTETDLPHRLVMIGPDNKSIFKNTNEYGNNNIILPGFVSKQKLKFAYENADVFIYPSLYEGFGIPPFEALACGTPVVTSNTTSLGELVSEGALQVDPTSTDEISNALKEVITNKELSNELIESGECLTKKYTWRKVTRRLEKVFTEAKRHHSNH